MIYVFLYKTLTGTKPLCIIFDKVDDFIRNFDGTKCMVLFDPEKCYVIFDRIRYLIGFRSGIKCVDSHNYPKNKTDSDDDIPLEKMLTVYSVIISINLII